MAKTIIFANGQSAELVKIKKYIQPDDTIICADGGTIHALALGLTPDFIVGDLDSLPVEIAEQMRQAGIDIRQFPSKKDKTDLELALLLAKEREATEILILTALGGRLDQTVANLLLLTRADWQSCRISLAEGDQYAWILRGPDELTILRKPGDVLSVIPLTPVITGVSLIGFEFPATDETFYFGSTLPISNSFIEHKGIVKIEQGIAIVIGTS